LGSIYRSEKKYDFAAKEKKNLFLPSQLQSKKEISQNTKRNPKKGQLNLSPFIYIYFLFIVGLASPRRLPFKELIPLLDLECGES